MKKGCDKKNNLFRAKKIFPIFLPKQKRGQVWVETVIYTLIAFSLMALVLGFARPKIQEFQDKTAIEQTINAMQQLDIVFDEIKSVPGNKRIVEFGINDGFLKIDGEENKVEFQIEGSYTYSESGVKIQEGNLDIITEKRGKLNFINVTRDYSDYNLTYDGKDESKILSRASTPYKIVLTNEGKDSQQKTIINFGLS